MEGGGEGEGRRIRLEMCGFAENIHKKKNSQSQSLLSCRESALEPRFKERDDERTRDKNPTTGKKR